MFHSTRYGHESVSFKMIPPSTPEILHITSGDAAADMLAASKLPGETLAWRDVLYAGPRRAGWPDEEGRCTRAAFLEGETGGGLERSTILQSLRRQYDKLSETAAGRSVVLWFDACLFDQSMLAHLLACLHDRRTANVDLLCVAEYPGVTPFHGLGQLRPDQLAGLYGDRRPVTPEQFAFAVKVDEVFATQDANAMSGLADMKDAPLPWIPAAATRWLQELPDPETGLGRLETLALQAVRDGCETPGHIFAAVAAADTPPQFWGDTTLWAKLNALADRDPPLVEIRGPQHRLPLWNGGVALAEFTILSTQVEDETVAAASRR